jgi:hypothetical protein
MLSGADRPVGGTPQKKKKTPNQPINQINQSTVLKETKAVVGGVFFFFFF